MHGELPSDFETLEYGIYLFSLGGMPLDCNGAAEKLLGYDESQLANTSLSELVLERGDRSYSDVKEQLLAGLAGSESFEWQIKRANGEARWVHATVSEIRITGESYILCELQDLTEYKARGRRLELLYRVLRHNLRNDMTVIQGHASNLEEAIEQDDLQVQIATIKETAQAVGELSDSVANLERLIEKDATERETTVVADVLSNIVDGLRVENSHATIEVEIECDSSVMVSADDGFGLVLEHAIENAIEHNESDTPSVRIQLDATDNEVIIKIADNGPGIPEMEIDTLDGVTTPVSHGGGLGLSLIQWCTKSLGGTIAIETTEGNGSMLELRLPRLVKK